MMRNPMIALTALSLAALAALAQAAPTLPPLEDGKAPTNLDELWHGFDPQAEPLNTTVVREWNQEGVTCRYLLFTIGTFKGKTSRIAAFYAFPKSDKKLPALLHLHGGGQRASLTEVVFMAMNGYAGLSLNWGANPMDGMKDGDPNTDWGAVDPTQNGHNSHYYSMAPDDKTLDSVESPRNNNWFLLLLAARRGLTFLEQQPEVDAGRLGVCGHSMGGKLTTDIAGIDSRVRAAVASCGGAGSAPEAVSSMPGSGQRSDQSKWMLNTIDDRAYIPRVRCPILYLAPTNDFNSVLDDMAENWKLIGSKDGRYAISPHFNHRHGKEFAVCEYLWFDRYLKGGPEMPGTPALTVNLEAAGGIPVAKLQPDHASEVERACIYYSVDPHALTRFWRDGRAERQGDAWVARCPIMSTDQPLYVHASVYYPLRQTFKGYQWLEFGGIKEYAISSTLITIAPAELKRKRVQATDTPETMIDDFSRGWQDWYRLEWANPEFWEAVTRKVKDVKWRGGDGASLAVDILSPAVTSLVVRARQADWDAYPGIPAGEFAAYRAIKGSPDWQTVTFTLSEFRPANERTKVPLANWKYLTELELAGMGEVLAEGKTTKLGGLPWPEPRQFRNLRWVAGGGLSLPTYTTGPEGTARTRPGTSVPR